ncbi:MAG: histidine phosphatase family protein [Thiohalocapsa sp.]
MNTLPIAHLVRHGDTEWSANHKHTGLTDIELTPAGEAEARAAGPALTDLRPAVVLVSPLRRALHTAELAGFAATLEREPDLVEWNYGADEGLTTTEIQSRRPGWFLFRDGSPDGESPGQIGRRADRVVTRLRALNGDALVFSHGHFLRVLAARWLGLPVEFGRYLPLSTAAISTLGYEHGPNEPAILRWNDISHLRTLQDGPD